MLATILYLKDYKAHKAAATSSRLLTKSRLPPLPVELSSLFYWDTASAFKHKKNDVLKDS